MSIKYDIHLHTDFSPDSPTPLSDQLAQAVRLSLEGVCITDHMDHGFPEDQLPEGWAGNPFNFDPDVYLPALSQANAAHSELVVYSGLECGLLPDPEVIEFNQKLCADPRLDFVIGSIHLIDKKDPYYSTFWEGRETDKVMKRYFEVTLENIELFHEFQSLGHMDYACRYAPDIDSYTPRDFFEITDAVMQFLIKNDIAMEINTSSLKKGFDFTNPHPDLIHRYYELGGRLITVGSDAHVTDAMAYGFNNVADMLKDIGFREYAVYKNKKPILFPL